MHVVYEILGYFSISKLAEEVGGVVGRAGTVVDTAGCREVDAVTSV